MRRDRMRPMRPIPIAAAERIARDYGYDQVVIIARRVGAAPEPHGEHVTTYGVDRAHCASAAQQGRALKRFMGWPHEPAEPRPAPPVISCHPGNRCSNWPECEHCGPPWL